MKIKICGIREKKDLQACEDAGGDLIGFINIERSKRMVELEEIKILLSPMNDKSKAVLVIEPANMADAKVKIERSGIKTIQLHSLSPDEILGLKQNYQTDNLQNTPTNKIDLTIIRALGIPEVINQKNIQEIRDFANVCEYLLFDYEVDGKTGGTGRQIPTETAIKAAKIAQSRNKNVKLFLAGGMNIERIKKEGKKLEKVFDFFDVNSGAEDEPGVKNCDKINDLMKMKDLT